MLDQPETPLSEDEFLQLAEYLDAASTLSIVGLLGFLHAVALAPTPLGPRQWVPHLFPRGEPVGLKEGEVHILIRLLWRQFEHVAATLVAGKDFAPEPDDMDSCQAFSEGFVIGAEIDQAWLDDEEAWRLVAPLAYLCDQLDLVPDAQREKFDADPDAKALICREMSEILGAMRRSHPFFGQPLVGAPVAGRNDPCPCGSGRKFKRCCGAAQLN